MKILVLANFDVGLYEFRKDLLEKLLEEHEVLISLPYGELVEPLKEAGCLFIDTPVDRRGLNPVTDLKLLLRYRKLLKKEKPDLVITYTVKPNVYGGTVCRLLKIPYAVNITGLGTAFQGQGLLRKLVTFLYRVALKKAKVVFFENSANMELFIEEKIVGKQRCCLLSGAGVNLSRYPLAQYPPQEETVRFLFMGRVMREKGVGELFEAMSRLKKEGYNCSLDVLGGAEEDFSQSIRQAEAQGWLHYHGYQNDVKPFIRKAHCFVLPSYHEGMANTNLECASMGRPVITTNIPGCREAVVEGLTGLLCKPQDADSLYAAMKEFLKLPHEKREAMGIAGRRHMEAVFDKRMVVKNTVTALNEALRAEKRKKLCMITTVTLTNGLFLVPMAEYFHKNTDWDISLMCALDDPEYLRLVPEGVRFFSIPMKRGVSLGGFSACVRMWKVFRQEKFDLIQYCTPNASFYAALAGKLAGIKTRLYCQWGLIYVSLSGWKRWVFKTMEKAICALSTHVQPDSYGNLRFCHEEGIYPERKGSVVWNGSTCGIDLKKFDISQKQLWRQEIREELDIPRNATVFGFMGRITGDKGINELLTAFRELLQKLPECYLVLVGNAEKQNSVDKALLDWAQKHPQVRICGYQKQVERYLAAMDCYVLPSYREGFGSSIIEAEAMELPIIATDIPGPREAMADGITGLAVEVRSVQSLLAGMEKMARDEALRLRCGKAARQYVVDRFERQRFLQLTMEDRKTLLEQEI